MPSKFSVDIKWQTTQKVKMEKIVLKELKVFKKSLHLHCGTQSYTYTVVYTLTSGVFLMTSATRWQYKKIWEIVRLFNKVGF